MDRNHVWNLIDMYEEYKIYPIYEIFYILSIKNAANSAIISWERLNEIVTLDVKYILEETDEIISICENIVNQSAIISRYFFPVKDNRNKEKDRIHQLRGEKLRAYYLIDDNHILKNRAFRNYIEHFDENLDQFFNKKVAGDVFIGKVFFKSSAIMNIDYVFRGYIVDEFKFFSLDKQFLLPLIMEEIFRLYNLSLDFEEHGGRLKYK